MRWLYTLNLRAPDSTVILVANKCDDSIDGFARTAARVEECARRKLKEWHTERRSDSQDNASMTGVTLLEGVSRVSCLADGSLEKSGLSALIDRVAEQASTSMAVPPAWDLALKVFDALRDGRDPKRVARDHLQLNGPATAIDEYGTVGVRFLTREELSARWNDVVESVRGDLQAIGRTVAVFNKDSAFEGALWIRCVACYLRTMYNSKAVRWENLLRYKPRAQPQNGCSLFAYVVDASIANSKKGTATVWKTCKCVHTTHRKI